ncbi:MAG TPA: cytochrome c biogenesis protein CcdA [Syntrophorhabdales bacterium]|nr:cytochrome c biogenesis protein CcdA [Syntrophorhabdales bacterium]
MIPTHMDVSALLAFGAGVLSFFSPCVLPLVPSYLIFISGASISNYDELSTGKHRKTLLLHSVSFIVGFSLVFISLGVSSSLLGNLFSTYERWIVRIGGLLLIFFGLNMLNVLKIPFLNQEKMYHMRARPIGFIGSFLIGVTFSLGWTPCIGPVLASILLIASTTSTVKQGMYLLSLYSLGLAIPFFIAALLVGRILHLMQRYGWIMKYSSYVIGGLLIVVGILLASGYFAKISESLLRL